jgi:hypothetical protein
MVNYFDLVMVRTSNANNLKTAAIQMEKWIDITCSKSIATNFFFKTGNGSFKIYWEMEELVSSFSKSSMYMFPMKKCHKAEHKGQTARTKCRRPDTRLQNLSSSIKETLISVSEARHLKTLLPVSTSAGGQTLENLSTSVGGQTLANLSTSAGV